MKRLLIFPLVIAAGVLAYALLFMFGVHRPLTIDVVGDYGVRKRAILAATPSPRIVIFAGSNGRFSHSCAQITADTGIPCVNLSNSASLSLKFQLDDYVDLLHPGDLIYLPLEYHSDQYYDPDHVGDESSYLMYNAPHRIWQLYRWHGRAKAIFAFNLRYLVTGIGEMVLQKAGVKRRFTLATMNAQGDESGHNAAKAAPFRSFLFGWPRYTVDARAYDSRYYWEDVITEVERLRQHGVIVVGGLPTIFDDTVITPNVVPFLTRFYGDLGGCFITLPNLSRYPRTSFYDTNYHLMEDAQHRHSSALAPQLAAIIRAGRCPVTAHAQGSD